MASKARSCYRCVECGAEFPKWAGRCESCGAWNTLAEELAASPRRRAGGASGPAVGVEPVRLGAVAPERLVLAGFSQGGAIASHTAMRFPHRLAGLMSLSAYLPLQRFFEEEVATKIDDAFRRLPIFMAHGSGDTVVPMALGQRSRDLLQATGFDVEWHEYPMAHSVCAREIEDIRHWLLAVYDAAG